MAHKRPSSVAQHPTASTSRLAAPPLIASTRPRAPKPPKSRKGKERAEPTPVVDEEEPSTKVEKKRKRKARQSERERGGEEDERAARRSSDSSEEREYDAENEAGGPDDEDDGVGGDGIAGGGGGGFWTDASALPPNGKRVPSQLRALELGSYRSALLDTVNGELDLGGALLGFEELRRRTRLDEERVRDARGDDEDLKRRGKSKSGTGSTSGSNKNDEVDPDARHSRSVDGGEDDSDDLSLPSYPHPSSVQLAEFTHWPRERRKTRRRNGLKPVKEGIGQEEGVGWETVLEAVREREDISPAVLDLLEQRLIAIYGPPRSSVPTLPPSEPAKSSARPLRPRRPSSKATSRTTSRTTSRSSSILGPDNPGGGDEGGETGVEPSPVRGKKRKASDELPRTGKGKGKAQKPSSRSSSRSPTPIPAPAPPSPFATEAPPDPFAIIDLPPIPDDLPPFPPDFVPVVYDPVLIHLGLDVVPEEPAAGGSWEGTGMEFEGGVL
ncbi:hypothetical protein RQP46_002942 [Phenoliferia psychrophenolica]